MLPSSIITDMKQYYEARAIEYDEWFYRKGRYDRGEECNMRWANEASLVRAELLHYNMQRDLLELAPGTGIWTEQLAITAEHITAIDSSPLMLKINESKLGNPKIRYVEADLFEWQPDKQYDGIFFGFWLSHVPVERFADFLNVVRSALKPGGKFFFIDSRPEPTMSAANHKLPEPGSQVMKRILNDGRSYSIIKNFYEPAALEVSFAQAGLNAVIRQTPTYFIYGMGSEVGS